jgi:hypothetical protein
MGRLWRHHGTLGGTTSECRMDDIPHRDKKVVVSLERAGGWDFAE